MVINMPFEVNGIQIKSKDDYLSKGSRSKINLSIRSDLKVDIINLSKHTRTPVSVFFDVFVEMLQSDEELLKDFLNECKKY